MSAKYRGNNYLILGFDGYGGKLFSRPSESQNLTGSVAEGKAAVETGECASFAVLRVVFNSLYQSARWVPK